MKGFITKARDEFHHQLISNNVWAFSTFNEHGQNKIASNADKGQKSSVLLSNLMLEKVASKINLSPLQITTKKKGQTIGNEFEAACAHFIDQTFSALVSLRPGNWKVGQIKNRSDIVLGGYEQYSHLSELKTLAEEYKTLKNFLGDGYTIAPDIIVSRSPEPDDFFNQDEFVVDLNSSKHAMLRSVNHRNQKTFPILHASISCKFTMRSDRSQNTRTEALNLLRTRKGRCPHIASVTAEPMPSRLASLALGTGDLDYVYHFALYELLESCRELHLDDSVELLNTMIEGKRLKDISDLPLDLII